MARTEGEFLPSHMESKERVGGRDGGENGEKQGASVNVGESEGTREEER